MSDRWALALAGCAALGAAHPPRPAVAGAALLAGALLVVAALLVRHPALLCLGTALLVSALAARSLQGLDGVVAGPLRGEVTLLTDPVPSLGGLRVDVRSAGRRLELRAAGASAAALEPLLAGERVLVQGDLEPAPRGVPWLVARHVSARLTAHTVTPLDAGALPARAANALRRTLVAGAAPLSPTERSLFTGLVIGDDRAQPVELADDFLGAGLTHLLAVSGQNVAFALALAGPLLRRLRIWPRLAVTVGLIAMFGLLTRFEPSVLRAAAMAALAATLATAGHAATRIRVLALAVTGLLVVDPLLVGSVGFQLSVAAAGAITLLAPRLALALPGPAAVREAMAVTLAAQLGVAPVLLATFGPLPVASLPANLLAVPVAGLVMVWGLTAGVLAGLAGAGVAALVHLPTRLLLGWLAEVAARAAALPLGALGAPHMAGLAAGTAGALWGRAQGWPGVRRAGLLVGAAAVAAAVTAAQAPAPLRAELSPGLVRWHAGSSDVVVLGGVGGRSPIGAAGALADLRAAGVGAIDLLVVADASVPPSVVPVIEARHPVGTILVAAGVDLAGTRAPLVPAPRPAAVVPVGALEVRLTATADRLVVEARPVTR
jgi:competence protein ComEC